MGQFKKSNGFWVMLGARNTLMCSRTSLFVFSTDGPKQNATSLLKPESDIVFLSSFMLFQNYIRNWCQKWCCILFGVIYRENKQWRILLFFASKHCLFMISCKKRTPVSLFSFFWPRKTFPRYNNNDPDRRKNSRYFKIACEKNSTIKIPSTLQDVRKGMIKSCIFTI